MVVINHPNRITGRVQDETYDNRNRCGKRGLRPPWGRRRRQSPAAQADFAQRTTPVAGAATTVPGRNRGLRFGSLLGPRDPAARTHGQTDESTVRYSLSEGKQERPQ